MDSVKEIITPEKRNPTLYHYTALKRPEIRRIGTIACDIVETTPVVFHGTLYRFEYIRAGHQNEANPSSDSYFHFVNVRTNECTPPFATNYHFGAAYVDDEVMYVTGIISGKDPDEAWGGNVVQVFRSSDLMEWETYSCIELPEDMGAYNTGICKNNSVYTMLIEVNRPIKFRFRFAQSTDMKHWELLPEAYRFHEEPRYAGGPAIYTLPDDPYYYVTYLEAYPGPAYATCIARSKDLKNWTYSPLNPILMFDEKEDKKIANPFLTEHEQSRIERAMDYNNSDLELCEFNGRTILYYSWGCQMGIEFLAEAAYEGSMKDFLQGFFEQEAQ